MSAGPEQTLGPRAESRAVLLSYSAAFSYQITLGLIQVLVPLYALHLGYDLTALGFIVASQAVFGLFLRLFAGAIADQFGERWVLWASFVTMLAGMGFFAASGAFWMLILGQSFVGYSRATYWTATQSYASRINPARSGEIYGRINAIGNAGSLVGTFLSGLLAETAGYAAAFTATGAIALAGFIGSLALPPLTARSARRGAAAPLKHIPGIARHRGMGLGGFAAFSASMSMIISGVLFIPYFREAGYSETATGALRTIGVVGSVAVGVAFGWILARLGRRRAYTIALTVQGLVMLGVSFGADSPFTLVPLMLAYGWFGSTLGILYPLAAADHSAPEQRGMAMAYVGLYWGAAQLLIPAGFGALAAGAGLAATHWAAGAVFLSAGLLFPLLYRWFVPGAEQTFGKPAPTGPTPSPPT